MTKTVDDKKRVINSLSRLISASMRDLASEQYHPGGSVDISDDNMDRLEKRIYALTEMRHKFEVLMSGVILGLGSKYSDEQLAALVEAKKI